MHKGNKLNYTLHPWKKPLLIIDKVISLLIILFLWLFQPDLVMIVTYILIVPYLFLTKRKALLNHLQISTVIALIWMLFAGKEYGYNHAFANFIGINLYPFLAWSIGLFLVYVIYSHYEHMLIKQSFAKKLLFFSVFYWVVLVLVETLAYHIFNIRNVATAAYSGLPLCNCIHAPLWMQISYFALGPLFFFMCWLFKLENPHYKITKKKKSKLSTIAI